MSNLKVLVDPEKPIRDWLRSQSIEGVDGRVYVDLPTDVTYPAVSLALVDGGIAPGEAPTANCLVSFSVWAPTRVVTQAAAWSLVSILESLRFVHLDSTLDCLGAQVVTGPVPRTEPDGFNRFVIDAALHVRPR